MKKTDFSVVAPFYRWLEYAVFGNQLQRTRCAFLEHLRGARRVLILGDGDGRFSADYLHAFPEASVDLLDSSPGMIRLARERLARHKVTFHQSDVFQFTFTSKYDAIVSHFFLDCFSTEELLTLIRKVSQSLIPTGQWMVSEFAVPTRGFVWKFIAKLLIWLMYRFFHHAAGLTSLELPEYAQVFNHCGFRLVQRTSRLRGLLVSEIWTKSRL